MGKDDWPSMKATKLKQILRKKLGYHPIPKSGEGSHTWLEAEGRPRIRWAFHNKVNVPPKDVRGVLVKQAGLTIEEAKEVLGID